MDLIIVPIFNFFSLLTSIFKWSVIIYVIMSWLVYFDVATRSSFPYRIYEGLSKFLAPFLKPLRSFIPVIGGIDLSVLVLFLIINFLEHALLRLLAKLAMEFSW
ncbi:MAG: YggT family protein [Alphaproteobacteria bacterium]|nr:YggT family protein [Alphaproteobacteria bacterium]